MTTNTRLILDNGGGATLQLTGWAHHYGGCNSCERQCATDLAAWLASRSTDGWEGHEDEAADLEPTPDDLRHHGYQILELDGLSRDEICSQLVRLAGRCGEQIARHLSQIEEEG